MLTEGGPRVRAPLDRPRPRCRGALFAGLAALALAGLALLLPSCEPGGHFTVLGYSTRPNYDTRFHTIRVPVFRNRTFWTVTPVPGMEMDLTRAVVREIELRTPYKVVEHNADTELLGTITQFTKAPLSYSQFNYPREVETTLVVELIWRDLRTGEVLSRPARRPGTPPPTEVAEPLLPIETVVPGARPLVTPAVPNISRDANAAGTAPTTVTGPDGKPLVTVLAPDGRPIIPVVIRSVGHFIPELGQSITTAQQENYNRMAVRITEVMELGW
jgi:hypothetical protein